MTQNPELTHIEPFQGIEVTAPSPETPVLPPSVHADGLLDPTVGKDTGEHISEPQNGSDSNPPRNREARYRVERNEARAERDALADRLSRLQRAEVERLASAGLSTPSDLFALSGNDLADYLTDSGEVDPEKVSADVSVILTERPGLRKQSPALDPSQGSGGGAAVKPKVDWHSALSTPR